MVQRPIRMISHSYANDANANAQNLTVKEIARRLDPDRFHITLFASETPDPRLLERPNVRILRFGTHGRAAKFLSRSLLGNYAVNFYVRNEWVDALYVRARPFLARRQIAAYHVVSGIGARTENPRAFDALLGGIRGSQVVACNSEHVAHTVRSRLGISLPVVRNGVDFDRFCPRPHSGRDVRPRVLFAGSLQARKRPRVVLEAAARIPEADFRIVGSGPLGSQVAHGANGLPNVSLLPAMHQSMLASEMREADVFLLTSSSPTSEGAPQVLAQAAASGIPVVGFSSLHPEAVIDRETGFVVRDDEEMIERLRLLVTRRDLRRRMGEAGLALAHERFDWGPIVRQWEEMLCEAVAQVRRENIGDSATSRSS